MDPSIALGIPCSFSSDIYSAGVVFNEMISTALEYVVDFFKEVTNLVQWKIYQALFICPCCIIDFILGNNGAKTKNLT